ncbi:MAG: bifunctional diguanylate cyclase/phosphodiesterase [Pseudohongiella sp.]|nr:bifunctional diguanylate cyclase/phosphodiesterase [Pseudohongiella sp.]MDO9519174.1 bifunctional diguanylate cyclase/phosphodiesterase [Pseudohongiella sp.]
MRVLIISEQESDFTQMGRLLQGIPDIPSELETCPADPRALATRNLARFQLMLWGQISDVQIAARLLMELSRQQVSLPLVVLTDKVMPSDDSNYSQDPPRDFEVLSREGLSVHLMRSVLLHFGARRQAVQQQPGRVPDPLTGLSNRQHLREQLSVVLSQRTEVASAALLLIDVDQFKKVNVSYGQGAGDALIQLIAERIQSCLLPHQRLARIGGNEFAVIFQNAVGSVETEAVLRAEAVLQAMGKPFPLARHAVKMNVSLGLAIKDEGPMTVDTLFAQADMAMRVAKQEKGNTLQRYTHDMTDAAQKELKLESEIRRSLRKEDFVLHFQPRIDISRNKIVGVEALVRWQHPVRGLLPPNAFIRVAEDSGLIVPLGYWVIHSACKYLNELSSKGHDHVHIAVNVAFKQFQDKNFVRTVANIIRKHGISPGRLEFELTETTMMIEGNAVDQSLRELSDLGIAISLDDFGTGYSSFAHIQRLPISALKIDRSFVSSVKENLDDATIVKAIINLAHSLNMRVIAEGAETIDQVEFLREHKCDQVQGYYFSRPVSYSDLMVLLELERERGFDSTIARENTLV